MNLFLDGCFSSGALGSCSFRWGVHKQLLKPRDHPLSTSRKIWEKLTPSPLRHAFFNTKYIVCHRLLNPPSPLEPYVLNGWPPSAYSVT